MIHQPLISEIAESSILKELNLVKMHKYLILQTKI